MRSKINPSTRGAWTTTLILRAIWWALATIPSFYAPDIYIVYSSKQVPTSTYIGFAVILTALSAFAFLQWQESRRSKNKS